VPNTVKRVLHVIREACKEMRFSQELNENEIIENIRTTSTSEPDITKLRGSIIKKEYATGIEGM